MNRDRGQYGYEDRMSEADEKHERDDHFRKAGRSKKRKGGRRRKKASRY